MTEMSPLDREGQDYGFHSTSRSLIVVGVLLRLVNRFIPMQSSIKSILNGVVVRDKINSARLASSQAEQV
jgi:hypothetical protein